jgi:class 3 adenylate cyclase
LGDEGWREVLADHRALVRSCLDEHGGKEVGTQGDGFLMRFDNAGHAVACAVSVQRRLAESHTAGAFAPKVRIGVHAGEAVDEGDDLVGRALNVASRITDVAEPGEILVTEAVADHLPPGTRLVDRGIRELRGVSRPRHLLAVEWQVAPTDVRTIEHDGAT